MVRPLVRLIVTLGVIAALVTGPGHGAGPAQALGNDVCPEPNDEFQTACSLGDRADALGFIQRADDVDAYRFEALDFASRVRVSLADLPLPYQVFVADWRGELIASSNPDGEGRELAELVLPVPGSYYIFVRSRDGEFSEGQPYRLGVTFPDAKTRRLVYQSDYRQGAADNQEVRPDVDFVRAGGKLTLALKKDGTVPIPTIGNWTLTNAPSEFALTVDTRVSGGSNGGYRLWFARQDTWDNYYSILINTSRQEVLLTRFADGVQTRLVPWKPAPSIDKTGGVNRTVLQSDGSNVTMTINGAAVFVVAGETIKPGLLGVGAVTWAEPLSVSFDNALATVAESGPPPAGAVLYAESFDDPAKSTIGTAGANPDQVSLAIVDGEYQIKKLKPGISWRFLPNVANMDDATLAVSARLLDDNDGRSIQLGCREQSVIGGGVEAQYRFSMIPTTGRFKLARFQGGAETLLTQWSSNAAIKQGGESNRIEFTCAGAIIAVSVNGTQLASVEDATYRTGRFWIGAAVFVDREGPADVRYDDIILTQR